MRAHLKILRDFMDSIDLIHLRPTESLIQHRPQSPKAAYALENPGRQYAVYFPRASRAPAKFMIDLPASRWRAEWVWPKDGRTERGDPFEHAGGVRYMESPKFTEDLALRLTRVP